MENSIYLGLSKQIALQTNMNIIANNVANMNTSGYRAQNLLFDEYLSDPRGADDELSFVINNGQYENTDSGPVRTTGNPMDIYLSGPGFMGVQGPGGNITYSRAGQLQIDSQGLLTNSAGFPIAAAGGASITIPQGSSEVNIDENGFISNQDGQIGQIQIGEFENPQTLAPIGNGLYTTPDNPVQATNTKVIQGSLEGSNVKPVIEMTRMIDTMRSFQNVQNILNTENERLLNAIEQLTSRS